MRLGYTIALVELAVRRELLFCPLTVQALQRPGQGIVAFSPHPSGHGRPALGAHFVRENTHDVRKASDVKDLDVVVA